jgi:hypothetical protein
MLMVLKKVCGSGAIIFEIFAGVNLLVSIIRIRILESASGSATKIYALGIDSLFNTGILFSIAIIFMIGYFGVLVYASRR